MKNVLKFLFSFLTWLAVVSYAVPLAVAHHVPTLGAIGICLALTILLALTGTKGVAYGLWLYKGETVNVVEWARLIIKHLFKDNTFLNKVVRADEYVVNNMAVVIPNPGAVPTVYKNNNVFPLTAVQRGDNIVMYALNSYVSNPTFITLDELEAISYDKSESVYYDHFMTAVQSCADDQIYNWANGLPGASNVVYVTGAPTSLVDPGQTGLRATVQYQDLKKIQALMNKANLPKTDRTACLESNMLDQLTSSLSATAYKDFSQYYNATEGIIGRIFGFDIMERSTVVQAATGLDGNGNLVVNPYGQALGATDNLGSLVYQKQSLELALGSVHLFERLNDPLYTGDIANCRIKAGGRVRRLDNAGVYALMQTTPQGN